MVYGSISRPAVKKILATGVTLDELKNAYEVEPRPSIRKRLLALHLVLSGHCYSSAARVAQTSKANVGKWVNKVARLGWQILTIRRSPAHRPKVVVDNAPVAVARMEVARLLAGKIEVDERYRLECVLRALEGKDVGSIAKDQNISPANLKRWLRKLYRDGASSLLTKRHHSKLVIEDEPEGLQMMAAQEADPYVAKALRALALVAKGRNADEAGWQVGVTPTTVGQWVAAYRKHGVNGLRVDRSKCCRPSKLTGQQKADLAVILKSGPNMSWQEIWQTVSIGFGVDYSMSGIMRLVREDLKMRPARARPRAYNTAT